MENSKGSEGELLTGHVVAPETKRAVVEGLYEAWLRAPELRLGELIEKALEFRDLTAEPMRYIEDEALVVAVRTFVDIVLTTFP